jgi:hypothetical protein
MAGPVRAWQEARGIPANRILCGAFGADRRAAGADAWNRDVLAVLEENGWHWTYSAFRPRAGDGSDYELGPDPGSSERSGSTLMRAFVEAMQGESGIGSSSTTGARASSAATLEADPTGGSR